VHPADQTERQPPSSGARSIGTRRLGPAFWITAGYAFISVVWIGVSDRFVAALVHTSEEQAFWSTVKGIGFITVTSLLLFLGIRWSLARERASLQKVAEGEDLFRAEFDEHAAVKLLIEPEGGRIVDANQAAADYYGWPRERLRQMKIDEINTLSPEEIAQEMQKARDLRRTQFEFRHRLANGSIRDVAVFSSKSRVAGRDLLHSTVHDITERKRAEEALRHTSGYLSSLIDHANAPIIVWDPERKITLFNYAFERMTGYSAEEVTGRGLEVLFAEESRNESLAKIASTAEGVRWESVEIPIRCKNGEVRIVLWNSANVHGPDGSTLQATIAQGQDITQRTRAEQEARDLLAQVRVERDKLAALLDSIRDEVWFMEPDGRVALVNQAALREFGAGVSSGTEIEKLARSLEVYRADGSVRPVEESPVIRALRGELVVNQEEIVRMPSSGELRYRQVSSTPVKDVAGRVIGAVSVVRDITDHKQADAERERLATAIEQAAETVVITDVHGAITYVNPAFELVTGYSRAEALGQNPRILKSGAQGAEFYRHLWDTVVSGRTWRGRLVNRSKDGRTFTEEAAISPVRDASGNIKSFVAVKRDISGELDLQARFLQSQKLESVGRLAGGVAHDFNNLLTVILSAGEDLRQATRSGRNTDPEEIDEILVAGRRAADLTRQTLAFARKQVIAPVPLNLNDSVQRSEMLLRRVIGEDIRIVEHFQPDLGCVLCDPGLLDQVVMNLVVNAKDAMAGGGTLTLATENVEVGPGDSVPDPEMAPGPYVRLSIRDTGAGMSAEVMSHLFEPFFTTKEQGRGTGLGLATVYGILKQSGAFVDVHSTPGEGTVFDIFFPRVAKEESHPTSSTDRSVSGGETVLVIEDDASVRHAAVRALSSAGYRVLAADGGPQALELVRREAAPLHLVLTDVVMAGQGGREVARRIAELRPGVRTLYMSGYTHEAISQHGVLDEGLDFLPKPFTPEVLLARVRHSLDRRSPDTSG